MGAVHLFHPGLLWLSIDDEGEMDLTRADHKPD
jgi:hypothetical protein